MRKQYSLLDGDIFRFHPLMLVFLVVFVLSFFTTGIIKIISIIIFLVILVYALVWLYLTIQKMKG